MPRVLVNRFAVSLGMVGIAVIVLARVHQFWFYPEMTEAQALSNYWGWFLAGGAMAVSPWLIIKGLPNADTK